MSGFDHDYETETEAEADTEADAELGEGLVKRLDQVQLLAYSALALLLIMLGVVSPRTFVFVPAGHQAVMFRLVQGGVVTDRIWGEGIQVIPPWDTLTDYDCRLQVQTLDLEVLSLEGIDLGVTVSVRYRPNIENLGYLHRDIGEAYFDKLVAPEVEAHIRRTFGERPAIEI
ncbi:MAG: hypothetical protein KC457_12450, partial [Myxococcales bacterium]|nr:hypothetical protein [Myxococcales bacterium]